MPQSEKRTSLVVFVNSEREEAINLAYEKVAVKTLADSVLSTCNLVAVFESHTAEI